jgi:hypothetical protein
VRRLNPLAGLRPRIAALVLAGVLLLAGVMVRVSAESVDDAYERSARSELAAIANTWEDGFHVSDLADPQLMVQRLQRLQELNPRLTDVEVVWQDIDGNRQVAQVGGRVADHEAMLRHPVGNDDAMLELHYDLAALDRARAADGATLSLLGLAAALVLGGLVSLLSRARTSAAATRSAPWRATST